MNRNIWLVLVTLLLALSACGGGGGVTTSTGGLTPLDFDVVTDANSTVQADDVIGYAVERTNPMYAQAETNLPADTKIAAMLLFAPDTAPDQGFSGDFTVRTTDRSVSLNFTKIIFVYQPQRDAKGKIDTGKTWTRIRAGVAGNDGGATDRTTFKFHLDYLGPVMLLAPTGSQFQVAAFADVAATPINTDVNFWALSRNGEGEISYMWDFGDGTTAEGPEVTHSYPLIADYNVTITATDAAGNTAPVASTPISVVGNPVLLSSVRVVVTPPDTDGGPFDLSATVNGGSPPLVFHWEFGNGIAKNAEGPHPTFTPDGPGLYEFELTVTDQTGAEVSTTGIMDARQITLTAVLDNPAADDPHHGYAPQPTHFSITTAGLTAQDTVTLDFGDGNSETILDALDHTYADPGVFSAVATVSRNVPGRGSISKDFAPMLLTIDPRPAPEIQSVTPGRGPVGTEVTLVGNFFFLPETNDEVLLGLVPMPVVTWEPREIVVTVPAGAKDGDITVHKALGGLVSNPLPFDVAPTPPGQPGTGQL